MSSRQNNTRLEYNVAARQLRYTAVLAAFCISENQLSFRPSIPTEELLQNLSHRTSDRNQVPVLTNPQTQHPKSTSSTPSQQRPPQNSSWTSSFSKTPESSSKGAHPDQSSGPESSSGHLPSDQVSNPSTCAVSSVSNRQQQQQPQPQQQPQVLLTTSSAEDTDCCATLVRASSNPSVFSTSETPNSKSTTSNLRTYLPQEPSEAEPQSLSPQSRQLLRHRVAQDSAELLFSEYVRMVSMSHQKSVYGSGHSAHGAPAKLGFPEPKGVVNQIFLRTACLPTCKADLRAFLKVAYKSFVLLSNLLVKLCSVFVPAWLMLVHREWVGGRTVQAIVAFVLGLALFLLAEATLRGRAAVVRAELAARVATSRVSKLTSASPVVQTAPPARLPPKYAAGLDPNRPGGMPAAAVNRPVDAAAAAGKAFSPSASRASYRPAAAGVAAGRTAETGASSHAREAVGTGFAGSRTPLAARVGSTSGSDPELRVQRIKALIINFEALMYGNEVAPADIARDQIATRVRNLCRDVGVDLSSLPSGGLTYSILEDLLGKVGSTLGVSY